MDSSGPFPVTKTFIGPISTHDTAAGAPAISTTCTVDAGDPPGLAFALPVVSPPSTIGTTVPVPPDLISSRTRHLAAAAARTPRATADYGFGPWPSKPTSNLYRAPTPPNRVPPRPSAPPKPQITPPPPAGAANIGGVHWPTNALDIIVSTTCAPFLDPVVEPNDPLSRPTPIPHLPRPPSPPWPHPPEPVVKPDDNPHLLSCVEHFTHTDWGREQRAEPLCSATIRFLSLNSPAPPAGRPPRPILFVSAPAARRRAHPRCQKPAPSYRRRRRPPCSTTT